MSKNEKLLPPIHPGEILREDYFNTSARFWLNLQAAYDLEVAEHELAREIERDVRPASVAPANWQSKSLVIHPRRKKFCNVFRSDAQRHGISFVDAREPSAHNALTSLHSG